MSRGDALDVVEADLLAEIAHLEEALASSATEVRQYRERFLHECSLPRDAKLTNAVYVVENIMAESAITEREVTRMEEINRNANKASLHDTAVELLQLPLYSMRHDEEAERDIGVPISLHSEAEEKLLRHLRRGLDDATDTATVSLLIAALSSLLPMDSVWRMVGAKFRNEMKQGIALASYRADPIPLPLLHQFIDQIIQRFSETGHLVTIFRGVYSMEDLIRGLFLDDVTLLVDVALTGAAATFTAVAGIIQACQNLEARLLVVFEQLGLDSFPPALRKSVFAPLRTAISRRTSRVKYDLTTTIENLFIGVLQAESRAHQASRGYLTLPLPSAVLLGVFSEVAEGAPGRGAAAAPPPGSASGRKMPRSIADLFESLDGIICTCAYEPLQELAEACAIALSNGTRRIVERFQKLSLLIPRSQPITVLYAMMNGAYFYLHRLSAYRAASALRFPAATNLHRTLAQTDADMSEALTRLTALCRRQHVSHMTRVVLGDIDRQTWRAVHSFHKWSPRPSHGLCGWMTAMNRVRRELWGSLVPHHAQQIFGEVLEESFESISSRYVQIRPSRARAQQYKMDVAFAVTVARGFTWYLSPLSGRQHEQALRNIVQSIDKTCSLLLVASFSLVGDMQTATALLQDLKVSRPARAADVGSPRTPSESGRGQVRQGSSTVARRRASSSAAAGSGSHDVDVREQQGSSSPVTTPRASSSRGKRLLVEPPTIRPPPSVLAPNSDSTLSGSMRAVTWMAPGLGAWPVTMRYSQSLTVRPSQLFLDALLMQPAIEWASFYKVFEETDGLMTALFQNVRSQAAVVEPLIRLLGSAGPGRNFLERLTKEAVEMERLATHGQPTTIMRSNTLPPRLFTALALQIGAPWLHAVIDDLVHEIVHGGHEYEIDPKIVPHGQIVGNVENLQELVHRWLDLLTTALPSLPRTVRDICIMMNTELGRDLPRDQRSIPVFGYIFLRVICPLIVTPTFSGYAIETLPENTQRKLILVSRVIQSLANRQTFSDGPMAALNSFLREHVTIMDDIHHKLIQPLAYAPSNVLQRLSAHNSAAHAQIVVDAAKTYCHQLHEELQTINCASSPHLAMSGSPRDVPVAYSLQQLTDAVNDPQPNSLWEDISTRAQLTVAECKELLAEFDAIMPAMMPSRPEWREGDASTPAMTEDETARATRLRELLDACVTQFWSP